MKIHLISDSHVEFGVETIPSVSSNVVVAAGDIGVMIEPLDLEDYFIRLLDTTDNVIWVLGNHEFYHSVYEETLENALTLANKL
jgi:predicted phosphodiesterase